MSHFKLIVAHKEEECLEELLQPYHQYECTGIDDEHVMWCRVSDEALKWIPEDCIVDRKFLPIAGNPEDVGLIRTSNAVYEYTNPNCKWDWWMVGGRFHNQLLSKDGKYYNSLPKKDIDFENARRNILDEELSKYDKLDSIIAKYGYNGINHFINEYGEDKANEYYLNQMSVKAIKSEIPILSMQDYIMTREAFIKKTAHAGLPCASILFNSKWIDSRHFPVFNDYNPEFIDALQVTIDSIPDDYILTVIDCHI